MTPLKFDNQPVSKYMHDVACYLDFIAFMVIREREVGEKNTKPCETPLCLTHQAY